MTVSDWIMCIVACVLSCAAGFGFMFWVAKEMVAKVKDQEAKRHQELINHYNDQDGVWIDCVNDIIEAVSLGKLENKSVKDQISIVRGVVAKTRNEQD